MELSVQGTASNKKVEPLFNDRYEFLAHFFDSITTDTVGVVCKEDNCVKIVRQNVSQSCKGFLTTALNILMTLLLYLGVVLYQIQGELPAFLRE